MLCHKPGVVMDSVLAVLLLASYPRIALASNTTLLSSNKTMAEVELHKRLFKTYNPDVIPRLNKTKPIMVDIEFYLKAVDNVDVKKQTLAVRGFLSVVWQDDLLMWKLDEFPDVTNINVKNEAIWLPDLSLAGTQDHIFDIGQKNGRAMITHNGTVTMWPYKLYTVACKIRIAKFPWDEQQCVISLSSWTHPISVIRLKNPSGRMDLDRRYSESGEWTANSLESYQWVSRFGLSHFDHVEFNIRLRRKALFHAVNTVMPTVCISLLNILCFLLPAQSGDRVTLGISIFLALAVFLTVINGSMPESSDEVAVFNIYVCLQLLGGALTNLMTVLSLYCFHKKESAPVPWPARLLARLFFRHGSSKGQPGRYISRKGNIVNLKQMKASHVTSSTVSLAVDRVCFIGAICWHIILNLYLVIGIVS